MSFISGPRAGDQVETPLPVHGAYSVILGRSRECAILIDSNDVSRRHAEIFAGPNGQLLIHDLNSINGTQVNGQVATQSNPLPLHPGDRIKLGLSEIVMEGITGILTRQPPIPVQQATQPSIQVPVPPTPAASSPLSTPAPFTDSLYVYIFLKTGQRYLFSGDEATIGRGQANDIVIENISLSRQHARLTRTPQGIFISDLGSTNKTYVNGVPANGPVLLHNGDLLRFGDVEADFKLEDQRLSSVFKVEDYLKAAETTNHDRTFVSSFGEQTSIDIPGTSPEQMRRSLEEGETNLAVNLIVVGRSQRKATAALPEGTFPIAAQPNRPVPAARTGAEVARMEGVWYTEGSGRAATLLLKDVKLGLRQGEMVALVGPSGSGKTELLQIMGGFLPADRGQISVLGYQIPTHEMWRGRKRLNFEEEREHLRWRNRSVGYMNGDFDQLNPRLTALEQVTVALEAAGIITDTRKKQDIAYERLQLVGLTDPEIPRLRPAEMNRREKQLVLLARALANDPPILLADEPMGNLFSEAATYVFKLLQQLASSGKSIFFVTHDDYWARNASRQIEILDGEIIGGLA
jgi:putative ABC transport system ATP-binding protein